MRNTFGTILVLMAGLSGSSANAADWQYINSADKTFYFMDFDSLANVAAYRKAWIKVNYTEEQKTSSYPEKRFYSQILLYYFDCKAKTISLTQSVSYSKINSSGDVVESRTSKFDPKNLDDVVPGSVGESFLQIACDTPASRAKVKAQNDAAIRELQRSMMQNAAQGKEITPSGT